MRTVKLFVFIVITMAVTSCQDWLSLAPEDGVIQQEYWQNKEEVNAAVAGCYASVMDGPVLKMFMWGELRADMLEGGSRPSSIFTTIFDGEISPENSVVDWSTLYTVINNCNIVLKFAPDVQKRDGTFTQKLLKSYQAEALTLRAIMYFQLVRSFKDVPLCLEAYTSDDQNLYPGKMDGNIILDSLVNDLKIAINNAPATYGTNLKDKCRITSHTAKTVLADIYLWQEKYAECNTLCNEIIQSGRYGLIAVERQKQIVYDENLVAIDSVYIPNESDAEKMFVNTYVMGQSIESIFEIPFTTEKNNQFYTFLGPSINSLRVKSDIVDGGIFPSPLYSSYKAAIDVRGEGCSFRNGLVWKYIGTSRNGITRNSLNYTTPWIFYKYADVLLMKAEACNQLGLRADDIVAQQFYKEAVESLNALRDARNAVPTDAYKFSIGNIDGKELEKAILQERAREFAYEGKRWFDVLRYAKRDNYGGNNLDYLIHLAVNSATPSKQQSLIAKYRDPKRNSHYWPIYIKEIETNKNITQNEYYSK